MRVRAPPSALNKTSKVLGNFHESTKIASRNIRLYIFIKVFAKRVFLPLSAIYFIDHVGFSIREIGLLAAFYSIVQLIANSVLLALVPMTYVIDPKYPFIIGTIAYLSLFIFALFMHDVTSSTSVVKLKFPDFRKITGKRYLLLFGLTFGIISALYLDFLAIYLSILVSYLVYLLLPTAAQH